MKNLKLSTQILAVSVFILFIFSFASFGILYRALTNQATQEMDQLLKNESLALSALVNATFNGNFQFEMHSQFLNQYHQRNPNGFFRFFNPANGQLLQESEGAPNIGCTHESSNSSVVLGNQSYRIETFLFNPEFDGEQDSKASTLQAPQVCLVTGINRASYWRVVVDILFSSVPILISIVIVLILLLLLLLRGLTRDLFALASALTTANFSGTHAFPNLPKPRTQEVKAIVDVLEDLHHQASEVYREMWLFMGRAAHQIKTPVTAMQATIEVLLRKERTKDELLSGLEDVQLAVGLLNGLTKKLISSSRISYLEDITLETLHLPLFFKQLVEVFKSKASESRVEIKIRTERALYVTANHSLMSDIFGNLLENAILYSPHYKNAVVSLDWYTEGNFVIIEVSDQGQGFPESIKSDLFKPFVRGDERAATGSGLGLSIAKKSVSLLYGRIELIESTQQGSKIRVWMPLKFE